jgi:hypothetical protein
MPHLHPRIYLAMAGIALSIGAPATAALAQGTVKAVFEKLDLLGRYAEDCSKPTTSQNFLIVHQAVDGDRSGGRSIPVRRNSCFQF